jgi:hypothetical protein
MASEHELRQEIEQLRKRIERLERQLGLTEARETPAPPPPLAAGPVAAPPPPRPTAGPPPIARPHPPLAPPAPLALPPIAARDSAGRLAGPPPAPPPIAAAAPARGSSPIEFLIGGKIAAWVGAIAIVIAAALAVHLSITSDWWSNLTALARCLTIAGFGALLTGGGVIALVRISRLASVGLFGAGLGVLYLDAFAAFARFEVVSREWSFALMAAVAAIGFAVTAWTGFRSIAVLSLVGGYLTPILLRGGGSHDLEVLLFLTALLGVALGLSAARGREFRPLRWLALAGQTLLGVVWLIDRGQAQWVMAAIFLSAWWIMLVGECTIAAIREESPLANPIAVLLATAAYVTGTGWILGSIARTGPDWLGMFTAAVAVVSAGIALQFGPGLDALRGRARTAMDKLAVTLWVQAGALAALAIALQFDDVGEAVGWLALGVGAIEVGRRLPSRGADAFGVVVLGLGVADVWLRYLLVFAAGIMGPTPLQSIVLEGMGVTIDGWAILAAVAVLATAVAASRVRISDAGGGRALRAVIASFALVQWLSLAHLRCDGLAATIAWLAAAALLLGLDARVTALRSTAAPGLVRAAVAACALRWLLLDATAPRLAPRWDAFASLPFVNGQFAVALAIAAAGVALAFAMRRRLGPIDAAWAGALGAAFVFALIGMSFEIDRAIERIGRDALASLVFTRPHLRILALAALWALGGLALLAAGRARWLAALVDWGLVLVTLAGFAWLTWGTIGWRLLEGGVRAMVLLNVQFASGGVVAAAAFAAAALWRRSDRARTAPRNGRAVTALLVGLGTAAILWLGSFEIDRFFTDQSMGAKAALSVFWAVFGAALVAIGFARRSAAARYAGLALLAVTVGKVVFYDLANVERMWRVVSFLASGLLLVATSLLYARLSPKVRAEP